MYSKGGPQDYLGGCGDTGISACSIDLAGWREVKQARANRVQRRVYVPRKWYYQHGGNRLKTWGGTPLYRWRGKVKFFGKCLNVVGYAFSPFYYPTEWDTDCEQESD